MDDRLILFDVDGTLIDTAGAGRRAMERAFHEVHRLDGVSSRASGVRYAGMTDPQILSSVAEAVGLEPDNFRATASVLEQRFLQALGDEMSRPDPRRRILPGVRILLDFLAAQDRVHLGLLTGNLERGARIKLDAFGLNAYFPGGGFASDHADRRQIARVALAKLSELEGIEFAKADVVVIGDTEHDVDCAKANGFRSVAVNSGWVSRECLQQAAPDWLLEDLSHLPAALEALGLSGRLATGDDPRR